MTPRSSSSRSSSNRRAVRLSTAPVHSTPAPRAATTDHMPANDLTARRNEKEAMLARLAEIEAEERAEAERKAAAEAAARASAKEALAAVPPDAVAAITRLVTAQLDQRGYVPKRRTKPSEEVEFHVAERDSEDTVRVQAEFLALIDLLGAVRVPDILEHVAAKDSGTMTPANARHHMFKLAADGKAFVAAEQLPVARGAGYRFVMTRTPEDMVKVWKKQPLGPSARSGKPGKA